MHVEIYDGGGAERVERGGEVGHGCGEDRGNEEYGDADGHLLDDEGGEDVVVGFKGLWVGSVEDEQADPDEEEEGELEEDDDSGGEQGEA